VDALVRPGVVAGDPAALEPAVGDAAVWAGVANRLDRASERRGAGLPVVGADIEVGQFSVEQLGYDAADRMRVIDDDRRMERPQSLDLDGERGVIGIEPFGDRRL